MSQEHSLQDTGAESVSVSLLDVSKDNPIEGMNLADFLGTPNSEINHIVIHDELDLSKAESENAEDISIQTEAKEIFESGKALEYMMKYCSQQHLGDEHIIQTLLLSYAGTKVRNNELGLNVNISGEAGSGKSHAANVVLKILPQHKVFSGRFSDKALLYFAEQMEEGSVISMDDQSLSEVAAEIMKAQTSDPNEPFIYRTVLNQEPHEITIPPRCVRWFVKCNDTGGDEQTQDRELLLYADNSPEHQSEVKRFKDKLAATPKEFRGSHEEKVCRKIWDFVESASVLIPFAGRIETSSKERLRNYALFHSLIRSSAILQAKQRKHLEGTDYIYASESDFETAAKLMNSILNSELGDQRYHLTQVQSKILNDLKARRSGEYSFTELREQLGLADSTFTEAVRGKKGRGDAGLCRVRGISVVRKDGRTKFIRWNREDFLSDDSSKQYFVLRPEGEEG